MARQPLKPVRGLLIFVVLVSLATLMFNLLQAKEIVAWRTDWSAALAEADKSGRPFVAYFTADWCGPCQQMKHTTWADRRVKDALDWFSPVKVDIDARQDLASKYQVDSIPTMALIGRDGEIIRRTSGYMTSEEFLKWLRNP